MFEDVSQDTLAIYAVVVVVIARLVAEFKRLRSLGPDFGVVARDDTGTHVPKAVEDWLSSALELKIFTKDGALPRGKRLKIIAYALLVLSTALITAAYRVSTAKRAPVIRVDYNKLRLQSVAAAKRRALVRIWIEDERYADDDRIKALEISDVDFEVVRPRSSESSSSLSASTCVEVDSPWSVFLVTLADEAVDVWIREQVKRCPSSSYDIVFIASDGSAMDESLVVGQNRAFWRRFGSKSNVVFETDVRELLTRVQTQTQDISPFLSSADGILLASFSLVNAAPTNGYAFIWDFEYDVERAFLGALPGALQRVLDVRIEAKVLRHALSRIRPTWSTINEAFVVGAKQTPIFIDSDWPVDTSVEYTPVNGKPLHFVVYIPPQAECPLHILDDNGDIAKGNGFIVEGWGGLVVFNPPGCAVHDETQRMLNRAEISKVVNAFVQQLREHLGVAKFDVNRVGIKVLPPKSSGFAVWEVDSLVHSRLLSDSLSAISTLSSLYEVISNMTDMAVPQEIADFIASSAQSLERALALSKEMRYDEAVANARQANEVAEAAFFHPFSLDGLQAYPIEYKVAALIPILLPTLVPLLLAFMREANHFVIRKKCAQRARAKKTE